MNHPTAMNNAVSAAISTPVRSRLAMGFLDNGILKAIKWGA
jgi:hypothetical protein